MKGAVRTIAEACGRQPSEIEALEARVSEAAAKGYRMLAVARGPEAGILTLIGLVSLYDPPRPDANQLIAALLDHGVAVKMLTGDALAVASEIASGVGLANIQRMADLKSASEKAGKEKADLFAGADGFAEVFPEDKYIVVKYLQAVGHVTGMTGDGVNDAPALRQAEVGIASQHSDRCRQGGCQCRPDRTGTDEHRGACRAGEDDLPADSDVDHQQRMRLRARSWRSWGCQVLRHCRASRCSPSSPMRRFRALLSMTP